MTRNFKAVLAGFAAFMLTLGAAEGCKKSKTPPPVHYGEYAPGQLLPANPSLGSVPYFGDSGAGAWANSPAPAAGQCLQAYGVWGSCGGVLPDAGAGGLWYQNDAGAITALPGSTTGQFLQTQGTSGAPPLWAVPNSSGDEGTIVAPPTIASSTWTDINFGSGTTAVDSGRAGFTTVYLSDFTTGGAEVIRGISQPLSSAVYTFTARVRPLLYPANNSSAGIGITDGTKHIVIQLTFVSGGVDIQVVKFTNSTTFSANYYANPWNIGQNAPFWLRIKNDGTHRNMNYSSDGVNYFPATIGSSSTWPTYTSATDFITTETAASLIIDPLNGTGSGVTVESWQITYP